MRYDAPSMKKTGVYPKNQFGLRAMLHLLLRSRLSFYCEGKVWNIRHVPARRKWNLLKAGADHLLRGERVWSQPTGLMIEPTDLCNLNCTGCWTNDPAHKTQPRYMTLEMFRRIIDELGDYLTVIWLWGWGEPLLNKKVYDMIRLARAKDIVVICSTNGNVKMDDAELEELVRCGLSQLIVAVDGLDQETYGKYRIGGRVELVLDNIRRLVATKQRLGLSSPLINMRMLVMRHNQHQVDEFLETGKKLGVDIVSYKTLCDYRKGGRNPDFPTLAQFQRYAMNETSDQVTDIPRPFYCYRPWRRAHVFADGVIVPCEFDLERNHILARLDDPTPLTECWNNATARAFRRQYKTDIDSIPYCGNCPYKNQVIWDPTAQSHNLTDAARA